MYNIHIICLFSIVCNSLLIAAVLSGSNMSKDIRSPQARALAKLLKVKRIEAELTQRQLADRLGWDQSAISDIETGQHRVSVVEFIALAKALEFDPKEAIGRIAKVP
jgi:DNA-binding XRE family transcriptional regulator